MSEQIRNKRIRIEGMTCVSCQTRIEKALRHTAGVRRAIASYTGGFADVTYDASVVSMSEIRALIEQLDYKVVSQVTLPGEKGGCNPVGISDDMRTETDTEIIVPLDLMKQAVPLFSNWKKPR
jgi:copper chaperone CopZ